ncbi:MAG: hypothetical protein QM764_21350 [Chitinophagaceae bacterium]
MADYRDEKINVWRNIFGLVKPHRKKLAGVFIISSLAIAVTLAEPLICRVAINDVAGLSVTPRADLGDSLSEGGTEIPPTGKWIAEKTDDNRVGATHQKLSMFTGTDKINKFYSY